jgi:hypothetical protein
VMIRYLIVVIMRFLKIINLNGEKEGN